MKPQFASSVVGGTFDHFHKGHEYLLDTVFSQSKNVTIGISTHKLYEHKLLAKYVEDFAVREKSVRDYLIAHNFENIVNIVAIEDIYGTTITDKAFDAIFVTEDNKNAADLINEKRKENGFPELKVVLVPFVDTNNGQAISSERIRKGLINRNGLTYADVFQQKTLRLPEKLRAKLRKPIGTITKDVYTQKDNIQQASMIISVGDIVTFSLTKANMRPDLSIVDFQTRRHDLQTDEKVLLKKISDDGFVCSNAAGKIESNAVEIISTALENFFNSNEKQAIIIKGEEDLLTLPAILLAPLGALVIYGQYGEGAVFVEVTEQKKEEILLLINQFD